MVKTYSLKADADKKLSENFKVKEFKCNDGSDKILISVELIKTLQNIRDHFGKAVNITSGYRTAEYNKKIGGATASQHIKGTAADIKISGIDPLAAALYAQSLNVGGIGLYSYTNGGFVHIDVREKPSRWVQTEKTGTYSVINTIMPTLKYGYSSKAVTVLQRKLNSLGFNCGADDGKLGIRTDSAIKNFQKAFNLEIDGICGKKTWSRIGNEVLNLE